MREFVFFKKKTPTFNDFYLKVLFFNIFKNVIFKVFKTIKETFSKNLRSLAHKMKEEIDF